MPFFDTTSADRAYSRWLDPPDIHDECGCLDICHEGHIDENEFNDGCEFCVAGKCQACQGAGYVGDGNEECLACAATGRTGYGRTPTRAGSFFIFE